MFVFHFSTIEFNFCPNPQHVCSEREYFSNKARNSKNNENEFMCEGLRAVCAAGLELRDLRQWDGNVHRSQMCRPISNKILKYHFRRWYLSSIKIMFPDTRIALSAASRVVSSSPVSASIIIRISISHVENKLPPRCLHMMLCFNHGRSVCARCVLV